MNSKKVVITGGPCVGKTVLIAQLEAMGYPCYHEVIREFTVEEAKDKDNTSLQSNPIVFADDSVAFNRMLIDKRSAHFYTAEKHNAPVSFFDRGLPDVIAYMDFFNQDIHPDFDLACNTLKYNIVFILPPWEEIYAQDGERYETFTEATQVYEALMTTYKKLGYQPIIIPKNTIVNRVNFILKYLKL